MLAGISVGILVDRNFCLYYRSTHPETGHPVPGLFACRFSEYAEEGNYRIPVQITSDLILPDGEYVCAECSITDIEYGTPEPVRQKESL